MNPITQLLKATPVFFAAIAWLPWVGVATLTPEKVARLAAEAKNLALAKPYIKALEPQLYKGLVYSEEEMKAFEWTYDDHYEAFREGYTNDLLPRLKNLSQFVSGRAIRWVDLDGDGVLDLIFWTEGVSTGEWSMREQVFVVRINSKQKQVEGAVKVGSNYVKLLASQEIPSDKEAGSAWMVGRGSVSLENLSNGKTRYSSSEFYAAERKDKSFAWVLSVDRFSGVYGLIRSIVEITYDDGEVRLNDFKSMLPVGLNEKVGLLPSADADDLDEAKRLFSSMQQHLEGLVASNKLPVSGEGNVLLFAQPGEKADAVKALLRAPAAITFIHHPKYNSSDLFVWTRGDEGESDYFFSCQFFYRHGPRGHRSTVPSAMVDVHRFDAAGLRLHSFSEIKKDGSHAVLNFVEPKNPVDVYHVIELFNDPQDSQFHVNQYQTSFPVGLRGNPKGWNYSE